MRSALISSLFIVLVAGSLGCQGGRDRLLADLQSPKPEVRALALRKLADGAGENELVLFSQAAKDVAGVVRAEAAVALGRSQDPRVVDLLGELLADPDERVQAEAARALAEVGHPKARSYLTLQYARHGLATRRVIIDALRTAKVENAVSEVVAAERSVIWERNVDALESGALMEQVAAAEVIGRSGRPEAVQLLAKLARDRQVILAAAAVRGLAEAGDARVANAIVPLLEEQYPALREAASFAVSRLQAPDAARGLQAVALQRDTASSSAVEALLSLPAGDDTTSALCAVALDGSVADAQRIAPALRERGCSLDPIAKRMERNEGREAALQAIQALGPKAQPLLTKVLPLLSVPELRIAALQAVGAIGDPSAGPEVRKIVDAELATLTANRLDWVKKAPEPTQAERAASAKAAQSGLNALLGKVAAADVERGREGGPQLEVRPTELIDDLQADQVRDAVAAIIALGSVRAEGAFEVLSPLAGDPRAELRGAARLALASFGQKGMALALPELIDPLALATSRQAVAHAIAGAGPEGREALLSVLASSPPDRVPVLEALLTHPLPKTAVQLLIPLLAETPAEAALAATLLGGLRTPESVEALTVALEDPTRGPRRELVQALGQVGGEADAALLARELFHDSPEVRAAAAEAVARVGGRAHLAELKALEEDYYRRVREAAVAASKTLAGRTTAGGGKP